MEETYQDEFKDYKVSKVIKTCSNHYWVESQNQDANSDLLSINCIHCPAGASIDPKKFKIEDGKINGI